MRRAARRLFQPAQAATAALASSTSVFLGACFLLLMSLCIYIICIYMKRGKSC
jgi:hypothetical protein